PTCRCRWRRRPGHAGCRNGRAGGRAARPGRSGCRSSQALRAVREWRDSSLRSRSRHACGGVPGAARLRAASFRKTPRMTLSRWLALAALLLALASPQALAARNGRADALYAELDQATQAYRQGLEQVAAGESETGRETMRQAAGKLLDAAGRCQNTRGCDVGRFVAAYDALLQLGAERAAGGGEGFSRENGEKPGAGEGVLASMPAAQRSVAMLKGRDLRELIELNEPVRAARMDWLPWMRPALMTSWENYQYMRFLMWPEYEQAGLPEALLFGILAKESNGRVHAVSRAGAAGPLQFMPATGARFGLGWRDGFDTRYDPQLAARASVLYFNERFAELGDELEFAIAAYNGGEGRARRLKETAGGKSFWDPA